MAAVEESAGDEGGGGEVEGGVAVGVLAASARW
jgi:hypothetical protein